MKALLIFTLLFNLNYICFAAETKACSDCAFTGTVMDAATKKPVSDVIIIARSIALSSEQKVVTDYQGQYMIHSLPAGTYTLHFEKDNYKPLEKKNLVVKKTPSKINIELVSADDEADEDHHNWLLRADFM